MPFAGEYTKNFFPSEIYKRYAIQIFTIFTQFYPEIENFQPLPVIKKGRKLYFCPLNTPWSPNCNLKKTTQRISFRFNLYKRYYANFHDFYEHFQPLPVIKLDWKRYFYLFNIPNYLICTCRRPHKEFLTNAKYASHIMQIFTIFTHFWLDNMHF